MPHAKFDESLSRYTTFRIGGPADAYVEIRDAGELAALAGSAGSSGVALMFLGWGSNLLVRDGGWRGIAARLRGDFEKLEFLPDGRVAAGAGVRVPQLVAACAENGLGGDESLVGIPGTVGGALVMNAGTRDGEIGALVQEVEIFDREILAPKKLTRGELVFRYRSSNLGGRIILGCVLQLKPGNKVDIMRRVQECQQKRLQTQPIHTYNVGSIFKNPPGLFVAKLIEQAGLKGMVCGGARISPLHANFIENFSGAKASDVLELTRRIQEKIKSAFNVELELEIKVIGEP